MFWFRVDNRLVHGQVVETWLPHLGSTMLAVVNDGLCNDPVRQEIMRLAIPKKVDTRFVCLEGGLCLYHEMIRLKAPTMFLFSTCQDACFLVEQGARMDTLNISNLHFGPDKKQICSYLSVSDDDVRCLGYFQTMGIKLDFRCVPNDPPEHFSW